MGKDTIEPTSPVVWEEKYKEAEVRIVELEAELEESDGYAKGVVDMILAITETETETPEDGWSISALEYELDEWCAWKIKERIQELKIEHHKDCPCNIVETWECKCGYRSSQPICNTCKYFGFLRTGLIGNCWKNGDNVQPIRMSMYSTCSMWSPREKCIEIK